MKPPPLTLYPHFTVQKHHDLWSVYAFVALDRPLDSAPLGNRQHRVGGQAASLLWQALTGHRWLTPARHADLAMARSARAYLQAHAATTRFGWWPAWCVARDWGDHIWPGLIRPVREAIR